MVQTSLIKADVQLLMDAMAKAVETCVVVYGWVMSKISLNSRRFLLLNILCLLSKFHLS